MIRYKPALLRTIIALLNKKSSRHDDFKEYRVDEITNTSYGFDVILYAECYDSAITINCYSDENYDSDYIKAKISYYYGEPYPTESYFIIEPYSKLVDLSCEGFGE